MEPSQLSDGRDFQPPTIDTLATCEDEPIHIPGAIQPHGCLFDVDGDELTVVRVSSNVRMHFNQGASSILGRPIGELLGEEAASFIRRSDLGITHQTMHLSAVATSSSPGTSRAGTLVVHAHLGRTIVEWLVDEEHNFAPPDAIDRAFSSALGRGIAAETMEAALDIITSAVKNATNYDRVMLYRFHPDWHGEVVSEQVESGLVAYRGLHYPASDIPAQARRLYVDTKARVIVDVYARDAVLLSPPVQPLLPDLDLSHAITRSVSRVHIQYLRNMGTGATFVTSLLVDGKLWGLIACHHRSRYPVPWYAFERLHKFTENVSTILATKVAEISASVAEGLESKKLEVLDMLKVSIASGLTLFRRMLLASGQVVICSDGVAKSVGDVPDVAISLARTLFTHSSDVGVTEEIHSAFPEFHAEASCAGAAWIRLSADLALLFIRPEFQRTVTWGGDPEKAVVRDPVTQRLDPRGSFDLWKETLRGKSRPWHETTVDALQSVRAALDPTRVNEYLRA